MLHRLVDDGHGGGRVVALIEGMSLAIPAVSTTIAGVPKIVDHGHTGLLMRPDDIGALSEAILRLLLDRDMSQDLGNAAQGAIEPAKVTR